jgi:hypothetical protein
VERWRHPLCRPSADRLLRLLPGCRKRSSGLRGRCPGTPAGPAALHFPQRRGTLLQG